MEKSLVTILTFQNLNLGYFVKEKFEFEGIECFLVDEGIPTSNGDIPNGIKLKVRVYDSEKAIRLLMRIHKEYDLDKIKLDIWTSDKKKILVPINILNYSINICKYAFGIAEKMNAELELLYLYEDPTLSGPVKNNASWQRHEKIVAQEAYNKAQKSLLLFSDKLKEHFGEEIQKKVKLHFSLRRGNPEHIIVAVAKKYKPDLIIMQPRSEGDKKNAFVGSIITNVIENTKMPVLSIPKSAVYKRLDEINILYGTNFNESDNSSLNKLLEIVSNFKTKIHCIHIDTEKDLLKHGKVEALNQLLKKEYSQHDIQCQIFESSDVIKGFEDFVEKNNIDWISFSSPQRTLFTKIFYPRQLQKIVSASTIPMLIFPV